MPTLIVKFDPHSDAALEPINAITSQHINKHTGGSTEGAFRYTYLNEGGAFRYT